MESPWNRQKLHFIQYVSETTLLNIITELATEPDSLPAIRWVASRGLSGTDSAQVETLARRIGGFKERNG